HQETGIAVWQSGAAVARSDARDSWMLGIGPVSQGSVYEGTLVAGNKINPPFERKNRNPKPKALTIKDRQQFVYPAILEQQLAESRTGHSTLDGAVEPASHSTESGAAAAAPAETLPPTGATPAAAPPAATESVPPAAAPVATPEPSPAQ
ncbi:MAG: DUF6655 family protein, partial [Planctomyces sp.]